MALFQGERMASKQAAAEIDPPYQFEWVKWYPNGKKDGTPFSVQVMQYNHKNGFCKIFIPTPRKGGAQVIDGVPHVTDKLLLNPNAAIFTGGWELTDMGVDLRGFMRSMGELMIRTGMIEPAKPGPPKKEKVEAKVEAKSA
jgi:hypothetical protein